MAPLVRARPYRESLTPLLHRRFVHAAIASLIVSYSVAVFQGAVLPGHGIFWSFFPFGGAGVRTALLFIAVFMTFIVQVAQLHVGRRRAPSAFTETLSSALEPQALVTIAWYILSAFLFCEAYMWSQTTTDNLSMVDPGRPYERPKLNERPIFLRALFIMLGVMQGLRHTIQDRSRISVPISKTGSSQAISSRPILQLRNRLPGVIIASVGYTFASLPIFTLLYLTLLRGPAWQLGSILAKSVYTLPKYNRPPSFVTFIGDLLGRFLIEGGLLVFLWDAGSAAFELNIARSPLKNKQPLTSESKDPNGTLLQGLQVRKEFTRTSAFWELAVIAHEYPLRRELIFRELDRTSGSTWSQLVKVCLGELHAVSQRIQDYYNPPAATQAPETQAQQTQIEPLPKLAPPLQEGQVFVNPPPAPRTGYIAKFVAPSVSAAGSFARSHGQHHTAINPAAKAGQHLLEDTRRAAVQTLEQKTQTSPSGLVSVFWQYVHQLLATPVGKPFRHTFARSASAVVIGNAEKGGSNVSIISDATLSLAQLAACSLKEDRFGRVSKDVASIIRTYTITIRNIENFITSLGVHWTDVSFDRRPRSAVFGGEGVKRSQWEAVGFGKGFGTHGGADIEAGRCVQEVGEVMVALREGLGRLVNEFGEFREELGLSLGEMRLAKEAVGERTRG